jgi:predicted DCC family thiol-disulfide oxidoreductase YuxK
MRNDRDVDGEAGTADGSSARPTEAPEIVFYDATCRLCTAAARFVARGQRTAGAFRIAALGDHESTARAGVQGDRLPDSLVVRAATGALLTRSTAVVHILSRLGTGSRAAARLLRLVPRSLRDLAYDVVARGRHWLPARVQSSGRSDDPRS